jgi:hypothetical protein
MMHWQKAIQNLTDAEMKLFILYHYWSDKSFSKGAKNMVVVIKDNEALDLLPWGRSKYLYVKKSLREKGYIQTFGQGHYGIILKEVIQ